MPKETEYPAALCLCISSTSNNNNVSLAGLVELFKRMDLPWEERGMPEEYTKERERLLKLIKNK